MSGAMRGGTLNRLIQIQARAVQQDSFGGQSETWTTINSVYAFIEALSGSERMAAASYSTDVSHRVTCRFDPVTFADPRAIATYRVLYGTRVFNIEGALNIDESNRTIQLMCSEGLNNG
jgi:SPP1 family predicted phage head-tail adaptor